MAQTVGGQTVSLIRTVMGDFAAADFTAAELDHATKVDAELTVMLDAAPASIDTTISRTSNGSTQIMTVMVWI